MKLVLHGPNALPVAKKIDATNITAPGGGHGETTVNFPAFEKQRELGSRTTPRARSGTLVGNGLFSLAEWREHVFIESQKNPHYWDAQRNLLERIVFFSIEYCRAGGLNFRAGQTHITWDFSQASSSVQRVPVHKVEIPGGKGLQ